MLGPNKGYLLLRPKVKKVGVSHYVCNFTSAANYVLYIVDDTQLN